MLCAAQPGKPLSALSSEKLCEAVCQYIQYLIEYLFYGLIYRRSLSGLLDIRSFVTESAETANRKLPLMLA